MYDITHIGSWSQKVIPMLVVLVAAIVVQRTADQGYALALACLRGCPSQACVSVNSNGATILTGDTIASAWHGGSFVSTH
jgi:hypothetical protein